MDFKCTLNINDGAKSPNTFSVLKIFNLAEVLNGKLPSFSFPSTPLWPWQPSQAAVLHILLPFQGDLIQTYGFKHSARTDDALSISVQAYPASCLEGSLENPTSAQSPHPSHILLLISSSAAPAKNPESPDFCLWLIDQVLQFHPPLIHPPLYSLCECSDPRTDSMPNVNASAANWSLGLYPIHPPY